MTTYWHTGAHECSAEEVVAFIAWASTQAKLERDVKMFMEPPFETFYDCAESGRGHESIICGAMLIDTGHGEPDPRPVDQRPTVWWRENCRVRDDWWKRYEAREVKP